jgi:acyl-CoA thioesterase
MNDITRIAIDASYSNAPIVDPPGTGVPNGGFLAGLLLRAIEARLNDHRLRPRAAAVSFLSSAELAVPLDIQVETLSRGGRTAFLKAEARQDRDLRLTVEATHGIASAGPTHHPSFTRTISAPEDCPEAALPREMTPQFTQHCEYRIAEAPRPFSGAERAEMLCWIRLRQGELDAANTLFITDAMFPAFFLATTRPLRTLSANLSVMFSSNFEGVAAGEWLIARFAVRDWAGAWCIEDAEIWSRDGKLLAVAHHMRRVFVP